MTQPSEVTLYENEVRNVRVRSRSGPYNLVTGGRASLVLKAPDAAMATLPSPGNRDGVLGLSIKFDKVGTWFVQVHVTRGEVTTKTPVTKVNVVDLPDGRPVFPTSGHGYGPRRR